MKKTKSEEKVDGPIKIEIDAGVAIENAIQQKRRTEVANLFYPGGYDKRYRRFSFSDLIDLDGEDRLKLFAILNKEHKVDVEIKGLTQK
ncbi:MAG TPA: hypothetical protein ENH82_08180 [bacterium]|nr:hypothetical protein [bacterium]